MNTFKSGTTKLKAKRAFIKKGTCSRAFLYILNREFGYPMDVEEMAIDPLAGGINQQGYQCGMLWGSSMAVGAQAMRTAEDKDKAIDMSINTTRDLLRSFEKRTKTIECEEITSCDFGNKKSFAKYMLSGKFIGCYKLTGKWAPEALMTANKGLSISDSGFSGKAKSCASELVKRMGGSEEEMMMVSGFAGGLGLSGNACGALAAAIWMNALKDIRDFDRKPSFSSPGTEKILEDFYNTTDFNIKCSDITGKKFMDVKEHTEFIEGGGCQTLLSVLSKSVIRG